MNRGVSGANRITYIGRAASGLLVEEREASVLGTSSRGVFINLSSGWVVFLSIEGYHGPLTINLPRESVLPPFEAGAPVRIAGGQIDIPDTGDVFGFDQAAVWQAPPVPAWTLPAEQRRQRLADINRMLSTMNKDSPFADVLSSQLDDRCHPSDDLQQKFDGLRMALLKHRTGDFVEAAAAVLGLGLGLTPSGDDLVAGLMLALNRWRYVLAEGIDLEVLNKELSSLAYKQTTRLSANLIECACCGEADERLILALDGIMAGKFDKAKCAAWLAGWGNTSGRDALAGMALAIISV